MEEVADTRIITITKYDLILEVMAIVAKFFFNILKTGIKLVFFCFLRSSQTLTLSSLTVSYLVAGDM